MEILYYIIIIFILLGVLNIHHIKVISLIVISFIMMYLLGVDK
jgi:hypothetical protein